MIRSPIIALAAASVVATLRPVTEADRRSNPAKATGERPPPRLCMDPASPYNNRAALERGVRVFFKGVERPGDVVEYDTEGGFIRVQIRNAQGQPRAERGRYLTTMLRGDVRVEWRT